MLLPGTDGHNKNKSVFIPEWNFRIELILLHFSKIELQIVTFTNIGFSSSRWRDK